MSVVWLLSNTNKLAPDLDNSNNVLLKASFEGFGLIPGLLFCLSAPI